VVRRPVLLFRAYGAVQTSVDLFSEAYDVRLLMPKLMVVSREKIDLDSPLAQFGNQPAGELEPK
jgi:hypothetical protein